MKTITRLFASVALLATLSLAGCSGTTPSGPDSERLAALEAEVRALKLEAQARETRFKEELAQISQNLEGIRSLIELDKGRAQALTPKTQPPTEGDTLDEEIDTKAKTFVRENLDRLLGITKKLLDKMEKELDEQMKKDQPAPNGDQI